jgi:hypothetical protein
MRAFERRDPIFLQEMEVEEQKNQSSQLGFKKIKARELNLEDIINYNGV